MDKHIDLNTKKEIQYSILKEYARYCDDNDLQYFLAYGTLLGAIRHSGYIPWDDDIDVMMPYSDFVKFIDNYPHEFIILKNNIINSFYSLLRLSYEASISKDISIMKKIVVEIKMIEFYTKLSVDNKLISYKKFNNTLGK